MINGFLVMVSRLLITLLNNLLIINWPAIMQLIPSHLGSNSTDIWRRQLLMVVGACTSRGLMLALRLLEHCLVRFVQVEELSDVWLLYCIRLHQTFMLVLRPLLLPLFVQPKE